MTRYPQRRCRPYGAQKQPGLILSIPRTMSDADYQRLERRWRWAVKAQGNALRILNPDGSHGGWFGRRPPVWKRAYYRARMFLAEGWLR